MDEFGRLIAKLKEKGYTVTAAESCTAGLFCAQLASVPGASDVLKYGFVVYSPEAKCDLVSVSPATIAHFGVVSPQTAQEMAVGACRRAGADCGVGITGFAGPSTDGDIPVGRVCFGYSVCGRTVGETVEFGNIGRNNVRESSAVHAARRLLELLGVADRNG